MNVLSIVAVLVGVVAVSTGLGVLWKATSGRVRRPRARLGVADRVADRVALSALDPDAVAGSQATILQFSTELCAPCRVAGTMLATIAAEHPGVTHVDIDVTSRPDIANRFSLLQSPTTLMLDSLGNVTARIGGPPRATSVRAELDRILEAA
jgi:thiol-disulfide isomerase/thioredoxin